MLTSSGNTLNSTNDISKGKDFPESARDLDAVGWVVTNLIMAWVCALFIGLIPALAFNLSTEAVKLKQSFSH
jgi:hypothetical protein